jgi:hypothetical protein
VSSFCRQGVQIFHSRKRSGAVALHGEDPVGDGILRTKYPVSLPMMALKGRLTSATSNRMFSGRKFSSVPNVTRSVMLPRGYTGYGPTPENG